MKDILTAPFVVEMRKTTANMYRLGWDERNGGNISWMLEEEEVAQYLDLDQVKRTIPLGFDATALIGKIFIAAEKKKEIPVEAPAPVEVPVEYAPGSAGQVMTFDVPDKTAALLMAIVADKMKKPLNELRFISIKEVKE